MQLAATPITAAASLTLATATAGGVAGTTPATDADAPPAPSAPSTTPVSAPDVPLRRGLANWEPALQGELASAQQALAYIDLASSQLQALKSELAARLSGRPGHEGQVEARVRQVSATWNARAAASGSTLDAQLGYSPEGAAPMHFTVRGLDVAQLRRGATEVLAIAVGSTAPSLAAVTLEPGLGDTAIVARLDAALAPAGIRASAGADGALRFRTPEAAWPVVRDTLAIRGNGIRYPAGQLSRVKAEPAAPAIAPDSWSTDSHAALRLSLQNVVGALVRLQQARASIGVALANAASRATAAQGTLTGSGASQLADQFAASGRGAGYGPLLAINSALAGISRDRVSALLALA